MRPFYFWTLSIALLSSAACSSSEDDGNRKRVLPPIPPPMQASLFFFVGPPDGGAGCGIGNGGYSATIGGGPKSSIGDPGLRQVNGESFARIRCRVSGSGTFELSLSAEKQGTSFSVVDGTVANGSGTATIGVAGPGTAGALLSSPPGGCALDVGRQPFQVAAGHIWAKYECPVVTTPSQPDSQCRAQGEFVFENCDR